LSSLLSKNVKIRTHKTIILLLVLYGGETLSLTLKEEHRLRVYETSVLKKIFRTKRDKVTGELRKLSKEKLCNLYSLPSIIGMI
jgi:hypothetical protein